MPSRKKLRYCKEHSASVVLSWCILWHLSGENLLMANQPLLCNWPQKLPNSAKWWQLRRSGSFKVTDFGTNRKPICDFLLVINTNLHPISHRFQVIADLFIIIIFIRQYMVHVENNTTKKNKNKNKLSNYVDLCVHWSAALSIQVLLCVLLYFIFSCYGI